jgi:hypothetical protein
VPEPDDDRIAFGRQLYGGLVEPGLTAYDHVLVVDPEQDRAPDVAWRLDALFREHPEYRGVALRIEGIPEADGPDIGVSSHARVRSSFGAAGVGAPAGSRGGADWGAGDRAALPGTSTQYRIVLFVCLVCGQGAARAYYDARLVPECTAAHGPMELVR